MCKIICSCKKIRNATQLLDENSRVGLKKYLKQGKSIKDYARDRMLASRLVHEKSLPYIPPSSIGFVVFLSNKRGWRRVEYYQVGITSLQ